jgi:hypothetical protein
MDRNGVQRCVDLDWCGCGRLESHRRRIDSCMRTQDEIVQNYANLLAELLANGEYIYELDGDFIPPQQAHIEIDNLRLYVTMDNDE